MIYSLDLLLLNGYLIDGNGGKPLENALIGIKDGKIVYIGNGLSCNRKCRACIKKWKYACQ